MRRVGVQGDRLRSLGGAHRSFLAPGVETHRKRRGRGKLRSALPRRRMECIQTPRCKKLRSIPPRLRIGYPEHLAMNPTPTAKNLRCAPPRPRSRSP